MRRKPECVIAIVVIMAVLLAELAVVWFGIDDLDEGYFADQAMRVVHGQVPYRDFDSLYTPGLLYLHAAVFGLLGGPYLLALRMIALAGRAALAFSTYLVGSRVIHRPLLAAVPAVFILVGLDAAPDRWEPHPGWLSTTFALLATACLLESLARQGRLPIVAGAMAALAFLFKQNTGLLILLAVELRVLSQRGRVLDPLVGFFAVTGPWLVALVIAMGGHLDRLAGFVGAVSQGGLFAPPQPSIILPLAALGAGLWLVRRDPDPRLRWVLVAGSALFVTQFPRMDTLHLAWSAPLLLIVGMAVLERARMPRLYVLAALALTLAAAPTLLWRTRSFLQPSVPIDQVGFAKGLLVPEQTRADLTGVLGDLNARMSSGEPIFVYPSSPLIYVLADRPNPTRFEHLYPGAVSPPELAGVLHDLGAAEVRVVVLSDFWQHAWGPPGDNHVIDDWIAREFVEVARYGTYRVLQRAYNGA